MERCSENEGLIKKPEKERIIKSRNDLFVTTTMAVFFFTSQAAFSVITPFFPIETKKRHVTSLETGMIFAIFPLVVVVISPLAGAWIPAIGLKFSFAIGCFIEGTTEILFGFVANMPNREYFVVFCFLIRAFTAFGASLSQTASIVIISLTFKDNISTVIGMLELFSGVGLMAGPAIGALLYECGGFHLPFFVIGGAVLATILCVVFLLPPEEVYHQSSSSRTDEEDVSIWKIFFIPGIFVCSIVVIGGQSTYVFLDPTLALHLKDVTNNKISDTQIGLCFLLMSITYAINTPLVGFFSDKKLRGIYAVVAGLLVMALGFFLIGPCPLLATFIPKKLYILLIALTIIGIGGALFFVPTLTYMLMCANNAGVPDTIATTSRISGIFTCCFNIGNVVGPALGGLLTGQMSFAWGASIVALGVLILGVVLITFLVWEENSKRHADRTDMFLMTCGPHIERHGSAL